MSIVITGATGQLGRLVVEQLMAAGTPPDKIVATGRDTDKLTALSGDGVTVRRADFDDPRTLPDAFAGAETLLLVSTTTVGERFGNHRNAIDAARDAGVSLIQLQGLTAEGVRSMQSIEASLLATALELEIIDAIDQRAGTDP